MTSRPGHDRVPRADESAGWEPVRDSWVEDSPFSSLPRSEPPPLPASVRELPVERSASDAACADRMLERLAAGDYEAALISAETLLRRLPRDADALDCAEMSRAALRDLYSARLGGALQRVPTLVMAADEIAAQGVDDVTWAILWTIDGKATLDAIAFARGVPPHHALRVLSELYLGGVIALDR